MMVQNGQYRSIPLHTYIYDGSEWPVHVYTTTYIHTYMMVQNGQYRSIPLHTYIYDGSEWPVQVYTTTYIHI